MAIDREKMLLYAVTHNAGAAEVEAAILGGATLVQFREKRLAGAELLAAAKSVKSVCEKYGVPLIINDNVQLAIDCGADGVHIGQGDMPAAEARKLLGDRIIGVTARSVELARRAQADGADYIGSGAVFGTATKADAKPLPHAELKRICAAVDIPVVAIGGIDAENISRLAGCGMAGFAVVSAIFSAEDVRAAASRLRELAERTVRANRKAVLTIAGSDCSGGAGIQADIKTITAHGMYAMSAITALTAQNTLGVEGIMEVPPNFLRKQLQSIFTDIPPDAVKIGMLADEGIIEAVGEALAEYDAKNIVLDPVMISTSGSRLLKEEAITALKKLFAAARVITPNIPEAEALCGFGITKSQDMERAGRALYKGYGCAVLVKGGHGIGGADDLLCENGELFWLRAERVENQNTHGTGCTLSSAIACGLAAGKELRKSVEEAKAYLTGALKAGLDLGKGSGPVDHCYRMVL